MKTIIASILLLAATSICASVIGSSHSSTYRIHQETVTDSATCSATAIGPHALLTATHCELPSDDLSIMELDPSDVTIQKRIRDGNDHTIYIVDADFEDYVVVDQADKLEQGESSFYFGNPSGLHDILRKGYVAGRESGDLFDDHPIEILFDFNTWFGDSGAGVFNSEGKLVAVITGKIEKDSPHSSDKDQFHLTFAYKLNFPESVLKQVSSPESKRDK